MGSRIAAHFSNAGIPSLLLDIVLPNEKSRNAAALKGIEHTEKQKPAGFFVDSGRELIQPGNFEDNLGEIKDCDWIIEAVSEKLDIKRSLFSRVDQVRKPDAIVSSNTSGIPLAKIAEGFSPAFRRNFLGTHFFNPPRYLHLLELIPTADTSEEVLSFVEAFSDQRLGKGVVVCKDTPNFIANRIGTFFGGTVAKYAIEEGFTIEEVDALTGSLIGLPNSASFRLLDLVGLDVAAHVGENLYEAVPHDPYRDRFRPTDFQKKMIERGWLGEKTGQGFYKRVGKGEDRVIHAIDPKTLEYHPSAKPKFPSVEAAKQIEDLPQRLRTLVESDDRPGRFLWKVFSDACVYSAEMVPEISDRIVEIDRAMRWGYAHKLGPFEVWDVLGFENIVGRLEKEGRELPETVQAMIKANVNSFYQFCSEDRQPKNFYFDFRNLEYDALEERPGITILSDLKRAGRVIKQNPGASLVDLGDGAVCVEFHSKMNSIGEDTISMLYAGLDELEKNFDAMVIANEGENFSVGANIMLVLLGAQEGEWDELNAAVHRFQQVNMALKYAPKPVVSAPFARTLGGGCEIVLHSARAQASAETYMGLVEVGVGLIPAGGGCKELILRLHDPRRVFELIGLAKVSMSAEEAKKLGLLHRLDAVSMNPERVIGDAKALALTLSHNYAPPHPHNHIKLSGESGYALLRVGLWSMRQGNYISDYDVEVGTKLAKVLTGGNLTGEPVVSEQYLLDLEREAFLSLCGNPKTQQRMQHMLQTGKPLRN